MARKAIEITIDTQGRDYGKTFEINEMNSDAAERWARRALQCYIQRGGVIPEGLSLSFATLQSMGIANVLANLYADLTDELCDEMFQYIKYLPPNSEKTVPIMGGKNSQIEEWQTRIQLRIEWINLHAGFSPADSQ